MRWAAQPAPAREAGIPHPAATCRYKLSTMERACGVVASVFVWRGIRSRVKWHYCPEHAAVYGYWAEDGRVMHWVQVPEGQEDG
jgi:hypothetical protein